MLDPGVDPEPDPLPAVEVTPAAASPGAVLRVESSALSEDGAEALELLIGGHATALLQTDGGDWLAAVPLDVAGDDGTSPPAEPVDVELARADEVIARGEGVLDIEALTPAPGTTVALAEDLRGVIDEMARIMDALHPEPSIEQGWARAGASALDSLVNGSGEGSLNSVLATLESTDPDELARVDALLAAGSLPEATQTLRQRLADLEPPELDAMPVSPSARVTPTPGGPARVQVEGDLRLAWRMQFYVIAKLFGDQVIHETATTYANTAGLAAGVIGIGATVPASAVVSAVLAVADFAVNKLMVGYLPARIDRVELILEDRELAPGEITTARIDLYARNDPPGVGVQDVVGTALNVMGLGSTPQAQTMREFLTATASFFLQTMQGGLSAYIEANPDLNWDISEPVVADREWRTTILDGRLVDLLTDDPELLDGLPGGVDWEAGNAVGTTKIQVETSRDPDAILVDPPLGVTYTGGAFGEDVKRSEKVEVTVQGDLLLEVELPETLEENEIATLLARAGYEGVEGLMPAEGLDVELVADGGTLDEYEGVTDADGEFITLVRLDEGSDSVIVTVTASDTLGNSVDYTVVAGPKRGAVRIIGGFRSGYAAADSKPGTANPVDEIYEELMGVGAWPWNGSAAESGSTPDGRSASASAQGQSEVAVEASDSSVIFTVDAQGQVMATASSSGSGQYLATAGATWGIGGDWSFEITGTEAVDVRIRVQMADSVTQATEDVLAHFDLFSLEGPLYHDFEGTTDEEISLEPGSYMVTFGFDVGAGAAEERTGGPESDSLSGSLGVLMELKDTLDPAPPPQVARTPSVARSR